MIPIQALFGAVMLTAVVGGSAFAQDSGSASAQPTRGSAAVAGTSGSIDVDRLPLDLQRIEHQLRQSPAEREAHEGLRLRYFVDVYGKTPRIELFSPDEDLTVGPTPWGAPTHRDMLELWTPQEFSAPVMDFNALMRWLSDKMSH